MDTLLWVDVDFLWWLKIRLLALNSLSSWGLLLIFISMLESPLVMWKWHIMWVMAVEKYVGGAWEGCNPYSRNMPLPSLFDEACVHGTDTGPTSEVWSLKELFWDISRIKGGRFILSIEFEWLRDVGISAFGMALVRSQVSHFSRSVGSHSFRESYSPFSEGSLSRAATDAIPIPNAVLNKERSWWR